MALLVLRPVCLQCAGEENHFPSTLLGSWLRAPVIKDRLTGERQTSGTHGRDPGSEELPSIPSPARDKKVGVWGGGVSYGR